MTPKEAALNLIRKYVERNRTRWMQSGAGQSMTGSGDVKSYFAFVGGGWVVPGHKRLRSGFVGVWVDYCDGRFEGIEFNLDMLIKECQQVQKPQQLRMAGF